MLLMIIIQNVAAERKRNRKQFLFCFTHE